MLHKTRGIVLHTRKYSDNSFIAKIYTEQFGLQSFLVQGARKKNSLLRINLFQPLSRIELVMYRKEKRSLQRMKEARADQPYRNIHLDPAKTSVLFFLNEVLLRAVREEEPNLPLFSFLDDALTRLDEMPAGAVNFHLVFLLKLSAHLGFYPNDNFSGDNTWFDLAEGRFCSEPSSHPYFLDPRLARILHDLLQVGFDETARPGISRSERKLLLTGLITYYELHLQAEGRMLSPRVLETILG